MHTCAVHTCEGHSVFRNCPIESQTESDSGRWPFSQPFEKNDLFSDWNFIYFRFLQNKIKRLHQFLSLQEPCQINYCTPKYVLSIPGIHRLVSFSILEDHVFVDVKFFDAQAALSKEIDSDGKVVKIQQVYSSRGQLCGDDHCWLKDVLHNTYIFITSVYLHLRTNLRVLIKLQYLHPIDVRHRTTTGILLPKTCCRLKLRSAFNRASWDPFFPSIVSFQ